MIPLALKEQIAPGEFPEPSHPLNPLRREVPDPVMKGFAPRPDGRPWVGAELWAGCRDCFVHLEGFRIAASWLGCVFVHRTHVIRMHDCSQHQRPVTCMDEPYALLN